MDKKDIKDIDLFGNEIITDVLLRDRFIEPPFSVLDTRRGEWQNRKRQWINLGIKSELGRGEGLNIVSKEMDGESLNLLGFSSACDISHGGDKVTNKYQSDKYNKNLPEKSQKALERNKRDDSYAKAFSGQNALNAIQGSGAETGTSIFDPALAEVLYRWFCPKGGDILDPFAGGSVRGIVANYLNYKYTGIELRAEQVNSNIIQAINILGEDNQPEWIVGDSNLILDRLEYEFDFVFSCPPYYDLEIYSDLPEDLSNMDYTSFLVTYNSIINKSCKLLKKDSFACFVISEIRDKNGIYRNFIGETIQAFQKAGMLFYNDAVLINVAGSLPIRAGKQFDSGRKLGRMHQNILVFYKGNPKNIKEKFNEEKI